MRAVDFGDAGSMRGFIVLLLALGLHAETITFNGQIAPILYKNCSGCHRPGQAAPFSLLTYSDAAKRGQLLAAVTQSRFMPPWKAEPASYAYEDERRLTDQEIAMIRDWVKAGMPEGDPKHKPQPPQFQSGWPLGEPDMVVEMPEAFDVPADGPDIYRNLVIPLNLPEDKWVKAVELRPSARSVVHHVLYFADDAESARRADAADPKPGFAGMGFGRNAQMLGGWALGAQAHAYPGDLAMPLRKGTDLVFQYHFHPDGKPEKEKSMVGLYFAKQPPSRTMTHIGLPPIFGVFAGVNIPPGAKDFRVSDSFVLPVDVEAISVGAHAHYLGKEMKLTATFPGGDTKTLLWIKKWDFAWQDRYWFSNAVTLPKGTRLDAEVSWDNSDENPKNPSSPPVQVKWGEESLDEMGAVNLLVVAKQQTELSKLQDGYRNFTVQEAMDRFQKEPALKDELREKMKKVWGAR